MSEHKAELYIGDVFVKNFSLCYSERPIMEQVSAFISHNWDSWFNPCDFPYWNASHKLYVIFDDKRYDVSVSMNGFHSIYSPQYSGLWQGGLDWMIRELSPGGVVQCDESASYCQKVFLEYNSCGGYVLHGA